MRAVAVGLLVLAACATERNEAAPDLFTLDGDLAGGGVVAVHRDVAWRAACRAMAERGGLVRADPTRGRLVGADDALEVVLRPGPGRTTDYFVIADTSRGGDVAWRHFHRRFLEAIGIDAGEDLTHHG